MHRSILFSKAIETIALIPQLGHEITPVCMHICRPFSLSNLTELLKSLTSLNSLNLKSAKYIVFLYPTMGKTLGPVNIFSFGFPIFLPPGRTALWRFLPIRTSPVLSSLMSLATGMSFVNFETVQAPERPATLTNYVVNCNCICKICGGVRGRQPPHMPVNW